MLACFLRVKVAGLLGHLLDDGFDLVEALGHSLDETAAVGGALLLGDLVAHRLGSRLADDLRADVASLDRPFFAVLKCKNLAFKNSPPTTPFSCLLVAALKFQ